MRSGRGDAGRDEAAAETQAAQAFRTDSQVIELFMMNSETAVLVTQNRRKSLLLAHPPSDQPHSPPVSMALVRPWPHYPVVSGSESEDLPQRTRDEQA